MEDEARIKRGYDICRQLDRHTADHQKELSPELHALTMGHLFGDIWSRPHLSLREREMITLAANIALCRPVGNHSHLRSALRMGFTREQIVELIIQVGHYAGWPTIALASSQLAEVLAEEAKEGEGPSRYV